MNIKPAILKGRTINLKIIILKIIFITGMSKRGFTIASPLDILYRDMTSEHRAPVNNMPMSVIVSNEMTVPFLKFTMIPSNFISTLVIT